MKFSRYFRIALLSAVSLFAMGSPSKADPISAAIITAVGVSATGFAASAITVGVNLAVGVATGMASSLLSRSIQKKKKPVGGTQFDLAIGEDTYRRVVIGECVTAGRFEYFKGVGSSNNEIHMVRSLCDWTCEGLTGIYVNNELRALTPVAIVGTESARYEVGGYGPNFIVKFFNGAFPQVADSELVAAASDTQGQTIGSWTSDSRGDGVCYVSMKLTYNQDLWQGGFPDLRFRLKGAKLYDRRKDSTAGGSGAHRWNDSATWEYSANPAVAMDNFVRGFFRNGQRIVGMGKDPSYLPGSHFVTAMNICDEQVTEGGVTGNRYECSVIVSDEAEYRAAVEAFRIAMAADITPLNGTLGILAGASYLPVMTLTDNDVLPETFEYKNDPEEFYNAVACKFTNPATNYQSSDLLLLTNPLWEAEDGGTRKALDLDLAPVTRPYQAGRIQKITHEQSRMNVVTSGIYKPKFRQLEIGDWVIREFNRFMLPTLTMKVIGRQVLEDNTVRLVLKQCAESNFTGSVSPVVSTPPNLVPANLTSTLTGFTFASGFVESQSQTRPTLIVGWTAPSDPAISSVQVEYRLLNNAASLRKEVSSNVETPPLILSADILAATDYEARIRPEYTWGGVGTWSGWARVRTTSYYAVMSARIAHDTQSIFGANWSYGTLELISNLVNETDRYLADLVTAEKSSRDVLEVANASNTVAASVIVEKNARITEDAALASLITTVQATANGAAAAITAEALTRASADSTLAASITTAQATAEDAVALVSAEESARISADGALSASIAAVEASVDDVSAGALFKMVASAGPSGVYSRITAQVRVATSGTADETTFRSAGWLLDVYDSGGGVYKGRMVVEADQFAIKTSGTPFIPFAVIGPDTYISSLIMGGDIRSDNFVTGKSGYILRENGTAEFQDVVVAGGTSTSRPFSLSFGAVQEGVLTDESKAVFSFTSTALGQTFSVAGYAKRTPTSVEYDITATVNAVGPGRTLANSARGIGVPWAPFAVACLSSGSGGARNVYSVEISDAGVMYAVLDSTVSGYSRTTAVLANFLNASDQDPFFEAQVYNQTDIHVWKDYLVQGTKRIRVPSQVLVSGTPTAVVGARCWLWGAAGQGFQATGITGSYGGPGGYVKNDIVVTPGEILSLIVGGTRGAGFGGVGVGLPFVEQDDNSGGGGSFIFRGSVARANIEMVAGGGGAGSPSSNGGSGGGTSSGGNNSSYSNMRRCLGFSHPGNTPGGQFSSPGGGGYEGGVAHAGGKNYIKTPLNSTNLGSAETSGQATTQNPPGTSEAVYTANSSLDRGRAAVGVASTSRNVAGGGMIAIQWLTTI